MQLVKVREICFQYPVGESDFSVRLIAVKLPWHLVKVIRILMYFVPTINS